MSSCKNTHDPNPIMIKNVFPVDSPMKESLCKFFFDKYHYKKTSSFFTLKRKKALFLKAGITAEAALALPIFLFFMANLLSLFLMYEQYSKNLATIHQQGKNLAMVAHSAGDTGSDLIFLIKGQSIKPMVKEVGFNSSATAAIVYIRKWTGYNVLSDVNTEEDEEYVYITESGTVYHRSRSCSHLKITVSVVKASEVSGRRNDYGQRYRPCEKCAYGQSTGLVFITDKGDKYHNSAGCSGLKRTIRTVKLSEVGGRGPCSLCGGG